MTIRPAPLTRSRLGIVVLSVVTSLGFVVGASNPSSAAPPPTYVGDFSPPGLADMYPVDVAATPSTYYVLDPGRYRIVAIDRATGAVVDQVGGHQGKSNTRISAARGIAVDSADNVFLADTANNRVVKYDSNLNYVTQWGVKGTALGAFTANYGIAVGPGKGPGGAPAEVVYVTDGSPGRVQKFTTTGVQLGQFGAGDLNKPRHVEVDPVTHRVFVVSATPKTVVVFDEDGVKVNSGFGGPGTGAGKFKVDPRGIAISPTGQVFVSDPGNSRVQVWSTSGTYLCSFGQGGTNPQDFTDIRGLALTTDGQLVVTDAWDFSLDEFLVTPSDCPTTSFNREVFGTPPPVGGVNSPRGMAVDSAGRVFVADWWNQRVQRVNSDGTEAVAWGFRGTRNEVGALNFAWDVAIQPGTDRVFVANRESHNIVVFESNGTYVTQWGKLGSLIGQFRFPQGVAFAPNGDLLVTDSGNNRIQRCSISVSGTGTCYTAYGQAGSAAGQFKVPAEVSVAPDGTIWVADTQNNRIQSRNAATGTWTAIATPNGGTKFKLPWGVTVAPDGTVWVADSGNDRVVQMQTNGTQIQAFTGTDVGAGAFDAPFDIAFTGTKILISDMWNNRIVELQ